ncbi:hypothetical protein ACIRS1_19375 [Kitasatospora sp. NPDC101176]|uniref:hypothetical protein n=1 Tax=Kitasatospora sp. NPDC101176 TaxID=3364099 RepID=UPI0038215221
MGWYGQAQTAEQRGDHDTAIAPVSAQAVCFSPDPHEHNCHLWHLVLLGDAGRFGELAELAVTDVHARRQLNRTLQERGMSGALLARAEDGDRGALYGLVRLSGGSGRARAASARFATSPPDDEYARRRLSECPAPAEPGRRVGPKPGSPAWPQEGAGLR